MPHGLPDHGRAFILIFLKGAFLSCQDDQFAAVLPAAESIADQVIYPPICYASIVADIPWK
nr:MAG TPA: hypothetical protein [Caudoviricetes sp.]